jgi:hypothetical protein
VLRWLVGIGEGATIPRYVRRTPGNREWGDEIYWKVSERKLD